MIKQDRIDVADDAVGVVCPVYAAEMPMMVRDFMAKANIRTEYFFFIYTYGMGHGEAFAHAQCAAQEAGLTLSCVNAIQMVDNYLPGFEMQDQMDAVPQKDVEGQLERVCRDITERKQHTVSVTAASKVKMAMYRILLAKPILKKTAAQGYTVNAGCVRCGICAKVCPANNISVVDKVAFSDRCEICYACLHSCP